VGWNRDLFWNGRDKTLETQALQPVKNPIEMHLHWTDAVTRLQADANYPGLFKKAFGTETVDSLLAAKAISQFMRTIVAGNSRFHKYLRNEAQLNQSELNGYLLFRNELKGDCQHCHELGSKLLTDNHFVDIAQRFHNNGLDSIYPSYLGLAEVTQDPNDNGKFKTPTLINIALTAPYMHDGRLNTLQQVIEHYDHGVKVTPTLDYFMTKNYPDLQVGDRRELGLTVQEKADLLAFLLALTDSTIVTNPAFSSPF
jgi:cytochrome c peroxidase